MAVLDVSKRFISVDISKADNPKRRKRTKERRDSGRASYRFVDQTRVQVSGGMGGKGSLSMYHMIHKYKKRPDGGNGGHGGSVIIVADPNEQTLRWTNPHVMAESGTHGSGQNKHGRKGKNTVLRVPCGVVVRRVLDHDEEWDEEHKTVRKLFTADTSLDHSQNDFGQGSVDVDPYYHATLSKQPYVASNDYDSDEESDNEDFEDSAVVYDDYLTVDEAQSSPSLTSFTPWGEREKVVVAQLDEPGSFAVVARGGQGGRGSGSFASRHGPLSYELMAKCAIPQPGDTAFLELELKMISDVGFVGFPNAGKSSLLAAMSRATPHIAPYPFTTLNPLVGYIEYQDGFRVCAADIPGLIAGASEGRGRGHDFLRHLERTKALLFIVDAAGVDGRDPVDDLLILVDEIAAYENGTMLDRNALIVANKVDLIDQAQFEEVARNLNSVVHEAGLQTFGNIIGISAGVTGEGLPSLSRAIRDVVIKSNAEKVE